MKVFFPTLRTLETGEIEISSKIEVRSKKKGLPSHLWYRFPKAFESEIALSAEPFAVSLLLLAMQNREPLEIEGAVSKRLLEGLESYQEVYRSWFPERFHRIQISSERVHEEASSSAFEACAFSGGVDSFYTLIELLQEKKGLTHAVFMAGFDMPLHLTESIGELTRSYSALMDELGLKFVVGSTNIRAFVNSVDWTNAHGQALIATALFFNRSWRKFYIPSSYTQGSYPKWGTHPELDLFLSTESLEIVHHGDKANRVNKLRSLVNFRQSHSRLRVCWIQDIGLKNCGQCEKCIRTQIALSILDALPKFTTFDSPILNRQRVRSLKMRTYQARLFARELMKEALRRRKFTICVDLGISLVKREMFYRTRSLL